MCSDMSFDTLEGLADFDRETQNNSSCCGPTLRFPPPQIPAFKGALRVPVSGLLIFIACVQLRSAYSHGQSRSHMGKAGPFLLMALGCRVLFRDDGRTAASR